MSRTHSAALVAVFALAPLSLLSCDDAGPSADRSGPFGTNQNDASADTSVVDAAKDSASSDAKSDATASADAKDAASSSSGSGGSASGSGGSAASGSGSGGSGGSSASSGSGGMAMVGGPDCQSCETQNCSGTDFMSFFGLCTTGTDPEGVANAKATGGPAAGTPKKDLCLAVLACVRKNGCATQNGGIQPCYCGAGVNDTQCLSGMGNGPCKTEIEAAAEISSPTNAASDVASNLVDPEYALGAANNLIKECDFPSCRSSCLGLSGGSGSGSGGTVALGTGGTGTGGVSGAGTGGVAAATGGAGGSGDTAVTYTQCRSCEQSMCLDMLTGCEQAVGTAAAGPSMGQARKDLCLAVVACVRSTKCSVKGNVQKCYCGTASDLACLGGAGVNGVCKSQIEAAAETTDSGDISDRFVNPGYPTPPMPYALGFADDLLGCDYFFCDPVCANGDPPGTAGTGGTVGGATGGTSAG